MSFNLYPSVYDLTVGVIMSILGLYRLGLGTYLPCLIASSFTILYCLAKLNLQLVPFEPVFPLRDTASCYLGPRIE